MGIKSQYIHGIYVQNGEVKVSGAVTSSHHKIYQKKMVENAFTVKNMRSMNPVSKNVHFEEVSCKRIAISARKKTDFKRKVKE